MEQNDFQIQVWNLIWVFISDIHIKAVVPFTSSLILHQNELWVKGQRWTEELYLIKPGQTFTLTPGQSEVKEEHTLCKTPIP